MSEAPHLVIVPLDSLSLRAIVLRAPRLDDGGNHLIHSTALHRGRGAHMDVLSRLLVHFEADSQGVAHPAVLPKGCVHDSPHTVGQAQAEACSFYTL